MRRETNWMVVFPNVGKEGAIGEVCGPIAEAYGGTCVGWSTHFGPRFVYEVPIQCCAGLRLALERAGFNVPYEYVTSQLARALAETTLPFSVHNALEALEEDDAKALDTRPANPA